MTSSVEDPRARAEARIGTVLDEKWTLERLVGLGGMAAVYAGRHRNGARGAIKILHADLARIQEVRERFTTGSCVHEPTAQRRQHRLECDEIRVDIVDDQDIRATIHAVVAHEARLEELVRRHAAPRKMQGFARLHNGVRAWRTHLCAGAHVARRHAPIRHGDPAGQLRAAIAS